LEKSPEYDYGCVSLHSYGVGNIKRYGITKGLKVWDNERENKYSKEQDSIAFLTHNPNIENFIKNECKVS